MLINNRAEAMYDVRQHPDSSSMGNLDWPPKEASDNRRKFLYRNVLTGTAMTKTFKEKYEDEIMANSATRMSGRVIVSQVEFSDFAEEFNSDIETVIPLADTGVLEDCYMVYLGRNSAERYSSQEVLELELKRAISIFNSEEPAKKQADFFMIRPLRDEERTSMVDVFLELYAPFHWQRENVEQILNSQDNVIMVAMGTEGSLAGSVLAEIATIEIDRDGVSISFQMAEISEAATRKDFRNNGLYGALSNSLLYVLADKTDPNLVFGEVNLKAPGALKTAARQGRIPAFATAQQLNIPHACCLNQHVGIAEGSPEEEVPGYNNLMPAWLTKKQLKQFVDF
ncbi:MAG: hypothetical protein US11_C0001G0169 [Candidatus Roizmanbacteria bacterium GW2011_GWA2_36_23]|uniref:Uncharacterized protein n=1 Tax=Candidatus Roizmanbacteria bacterium GW2011_GWA2_36_23 TaxID=1618480 RepID=A0A0G0EM58_9BACT|nr:MAG: hypothetical protein US11_C0001G0169 [Candidatus Roizmanbacteria bacterium GW2011_GWA2_36_23]